MEIEIADQYQAAHLKEWISPDMEVLEIQKEESTVWDIALRDPMAS